MENKYIMYRLVQIFMVILPVLENLKVQLENAKEEAQKEFPQEEELAEKVARLGELNVLLDMDKKDQVLLDDGEGVEIEPEQKKKERER